MEDGNKKTTWQLEVARLNKVQIAAIAMIAVSVGGATLWTRLHAPAPMIAAAVVNTGKSDVVSRKKAYPMQEASFELSRPSGNLFDYKQVDVQVAVRLPDGKQITLPAFYDGDNVWRVRYTPSMTGKHIVTGVTLNGAAAKPQKLTPSIWNVSASATTGAGFIRLNPQDKTRFIFDNGQPYYPLGQNAAWRGNNNVDIPAIFAKMGANGENWSRVWMNHWDDKNLDWVMNKKTPLGTLDLDVARRWDTIVSAAEKNDIRFQMTFQHHGQYSSTVNPNWGENPWNAQNGGFLKTPEEFFTSEKAKELTKAKYRYIIARYGYSPSILAWELFNEVQFTDTGRKKDYTTIAAWHKEMAAFLREQDPYHHLVTTSSDMEITGLYDAMDYIQPHAYVSDVAAAAQSARPQKYDKAIFYGEIGDNGDLSKDNGRVLHALLWGSMMSDSSGAAQYWAWDTVEANNLYPFFKAASAFAQRVDLAKRQSGMKAVIPVIETAEAGVVSIGPGAGWQKASRTSFTVTPAGTVEGAEDMPAFLQGDNNRAMFPFAEFQANYKDKGTFAVHIRQVAKAGAKLKVLVDGKPITERTYAGADKEYTPQETVLEIPVAAGQHTIRLENTGTDWLNLERLTFAPCGPALRGYARAGKTGAIAWLYGSDETTGKKGAASITVGGVEAGKTYRLTWWDTRAGASTEGTTVTADAKGNLKITLPESAGNDIAVSALPIGEPLREARQ